MDHPDVSIFRTMHQNLKDFSVRTKRCEEYCTILKKFIENFLFSDYDKVYFSVELGWLYEGTMKKEGIKKAVLAYEYGVDVCANGKVPPGVTSRLWNNMGLALKLLEQYDAAELCYTHAALNENYNRLRMEMYPHYGNFEGLCLHKSSQNNLKLQNK
jgi:hypothetical protein